jgi:hypothetical protein
MSATDAPELALGLVHFPILDRHKNTVATNITNFDIHDIARACKVFGVKKYYIIHPIQEQLMFVERVLDHWRVGVGAKYNDYRRRSLEPVFTMPSLEAAKKDWGENTLVIGTHARPVDGVRNYSSSELKNELFLNKKRVLLLFGTGYGMTDELMGTFDGILESIKGAPPQDYRHLSVRSAVSIYLDRVMGPW